MVNDLNEMKNEKRSSNKKTISAVLDSAEMIENIVVEGFKRGFNTKSSATKKIIELGYKEFLKLPVIKTRA